LQYSMDMQQFLGLSEPMSPVTEKLNAWEESAFQQVEIDICDERHSAVRADLMDIATRSSLWLRTYFYLYRMYMYHPHNASILYLKPG
jgi:hypothetical protein